VLLLLFLLQDQLKLSKYLDFLQLIEGAYLLQLPIKSVCESLVGIICRGGFEKWRRFRIKGSRV
jgi:hypothetical protein